MTRNLRLHRSGSSGLRSPIITAKTEVDMLFKAKVPEKDKNAAANAAEVHGERVIERDGATATRGR